MKRGTIDHPKTLRLATVLGCERWGAVGILESLWHFGARHAMRGDIGKWSDEDIATGLGWKGEPGVVVNALLDCGWLDAHKTHRLLIHDWHEHADQSVVKTLKNRKEDFYTFPEKSGKVRKKLEKAGIFPSQPEPSHSHSQSHEPAGSDDFPFSLQGSQEFAEAWGRWLVFRKEIKKPLAESTIAGQLKKLAAAGVAEAIKMIDQSIEHGWQGLFPVNSNGRPIKAEEPRESEYKEFSKQ